MFTGIIQHSGTVLAVQSMRNLLRLTIDVGPLAKAIALGDSVAVNGCCLTAAAKKGRGVSFDLMRESLEKTSLKDAAKNDRVNLELALTAGSRLGGHFVTGHVDEVGLIKRIDREPNWVVFTISMSKASRAYVVPKGSITIDGISLTVGAVGKADFKVYLIPYTLQVTNLSAKKAGEAVNIETDILAKYVRASHSG